MHAKSHRRHGSRHSASEHCGHEGRGRGGAFEGGGRSDRKGQHNRNGEFGPDGHFGRRGGMGRGGRRGKRFDGDELRLMVLHLLEDGPKHGYQLIRTFAETSNEAYSPSPGVLYPLLTLLQDMGLVEEAPGEGRTRSFSLTETGKSELDANRIKAEAAIARLAVMGENAVREDAPPVRRAMMNLRTAALQRLSAGGEDQSLIFTIADLIDEAARKIERL